jgi:hypothetical protein
VVIFSIGRNRFENPRPEVVAVVRATLPAVRVSCPQLSKHCAKMQPSNQPEHLIELFSRGKLKNECCSGTFLIKLGDKIEYLPDQTLHQAFIAATAKSALCN